MRPIKFRGRVPDSDKFDGGRIVYGSLVDHGDDCYQYRYWIYPIEGDRNFPVDEDSIAQFVGYDKAGNEVYEGDKILIDNAGEDEFFATCLPTGVNHFGGVFLHGGNFIFNKEFSLKEACQNPWNALQEIDTLTEKHFKEAAQQ